MPDEPSLLAVVYRGDVIESQHRGHVVVADAGGQLHASAGDPTRVTYARSSIKAYQLAPLLFSGAADRFGFDERDIAVMCSSHSGEAMHTQRIEAILERIGLDVGALQCGADAPYDPLVAKELKTTPTALHHNCSGKHANLLAQAVALGADVTTYLARDHPVQVRIREFIARAAGIPAERIPIGTDGCSAPNFAVSIGAGARLFATLADASRLVAKEADAMRRIFEAMTRHPELVAGTNRVDTRLMRGGRGRFACKIGGEAVFGVADRSSGRGLYLKIEDGNTRAIPAIVVSALDQLGWMEGGDADLLEAERVVPVKNTRGTVVGRIESRLRLDVRRHVAGASQR